MAGCCLKLKESFDTLAPKEQRVAEFILTYPGEVLGKSIGELARLCSASNASVVRLCQSIGYSGYKELCRELKDELGNKDNVITYDEIHPGDDIESIAKGVCLSDMKAMEGTLSLIDYVELDRAVDAICKAHRIDFYGVGSSGLVARDASNKFMRIDYLTCSSFDPHEQILMAVSLKKDDVAVIFSYSGETQDSVDIAKQIKTEGALVISVTKYGKNQLNELADIKLFTSSSESMLRSGPMGSRIGQLALVDILYTAVASRLFDKVKPSLDRTRMLAQQKR